MKLAVLGAGAWGTALAIAFAQRHAVSLWTRDPEQAELLARTRRNARYLPGFELPAAVTVEVDLNAAVEGAAAVVCAVPMSGLRALAARLPGRDQPLVLACKGFEPASGLLAHEVVEAVLPGRPVCILSGPS